MGSSNAKARRTYRRPILKSPPACELGYEPFLGSGTTLAAAELTERACYGTVYRFRFMA